VTEVRARVGIVGLGLIGGSLARALRRAARPPFVRASTLEADDVRRALADGVVDVASADVRDALVDVDLVVFATPVSAAVALLERHRAMLERVPVLTDVGSVKAPVLRAAGAAGLADRFVGGHPMCGRERSGYREARSDLFVGARVWLTPATPVSPVASVAELWRSVGAEPRETDATTHDHVAAWSSHVAQVLASALGAALARAGIPRDTLGPAGRDMTRIAHSPAPLWTDILMHNRLMVAEALADTRARLDAFAHALDAGDAVALEQLLAEASAWAERA
jgi:prephenate dehydrogenase